MRDVPIQTLNKSSLACLESSLRFIRNRIHFRNTHKSLPFLNTVSTPSESYSCSTSLSNSAAVSSCTTYRKFDTGHVFSPFTREDVTGVNLPPILTCDRLGCSIDSNLSYFASSSQESVQPVLLDAQSTIDNRQTVRFIGGNSNPLSFLFGSWKIITVNTVLICERRRRDAFGRPFSFETWGCSEEPQKFLGISMHTYTILKKSKILPHRAFEDLF